eukprot:SAG31_NODE_507_length_14746_cov_5.682119_4_plen_439_part_00
MHSGFGTAGLRRLCSLGPGCDCGAPRMMGPELPLKVYHRAQRLGEGGYGGVSTVYDDDGKVYAMKNFEADENDDSLASETLREISTLRLLRRHAVAGRGLLRMDDICVVDDEICMVMPKLSCNLLDATVGKAIGGRKQEIKIAHGLLSAVAFIHANGLIHRDIKGDNIMLTDNMDPVLIDFSLAKPIDGSTTGGTHTGNIGTAKYIAPEVYHCRRYGFKADIWSTGVVLLELFTGAPLAAERDKAAFAMIEQLKAQMPPAKPLTDFLTKLLSTDPSTRPTALDALSLQPIARHGVPEFVTEVVLHLAPCAEGDANADGEDGDFSEEQQISGKALKRARAKAAKADRVQQKRTKKSKTAPSKIDPAINSAWNALEYENTLTKEAAQIYWEATGCKADPGHCVLLASKLYEPIAWDLHELEEEQSLESFGEQHLHIDLLT